MSKLVIKISSKWIKKGLNLSLFKSKLTSVNNIKQAVNQSDKRKGRCCKSEEDCVYIKHEGSPGPGVNIYTCNITITK